jgi:hypothetical protein
MHAGSSFYITVGPPESTESKPEDGAKCLVHLQDPDNGMTLFEAQWDAQQIAFVADVFVGVVGGNVVWATLDVRILYFSLRFSFRFAHQGMIYWGYDLRQSYTAVECISVTDDSSEMSQCVTASASRPSQSFW